MKESGSKRSREEIHSEYCNSQNNSSSNHNRENSNTTMENVWVCSRCTFHNHFALSLCEVCEMPNLPVSNDFIAFSNDSSSVTVDLSLSSPAKKRTTWNSNKQNYNILVEDVGTKKSQTVIEIDLDDNDSPAECQTVSKPPSRFLLSAIRDVLREDGREFHLSYPYPHHITQINQYGSAWSCGYRNIQMLCSSLVQFPIYRQVLFNGKFAHLTSGEDAAQAIKDMKIPELQCWIQEAWRAGFDTAGGDEFNFTLVGKDDWIGTTECAALLRYFGIRAMVVDFHCLEVPPKKELIKQKQAFKKGNYQEEDEDDEAQEIETEDDNVALVEKYLQQETKDETTADQMGQTEKRDQRLGDNEERDLKEGQSLKMTENNNEPNSQFNSQPECRNEATQLIPQSKSSAEDAVDVTEKTREKPEKNGHGAGQRQSQRRTISCYSSAYRKVQIPKRKQKKTKSLEEKLNEPLHNMGMRLANWTHRYFSHPWQHSAEPTLDFAHHPPLYFQYMGHSRTIVGIEYAGGSTLSNNTGSTSIQSYFPSLSTSTSTTVSLDLVNEKDTGLLGNNDNNVIEAEKNIEHLLIFDPISKSSVLHSHLLLNNSAAKKSINKNWQRMIKKLPRTMRRYCAHQICYIAPGIMEKDSEEYERSKIIRGILDDSTDWPSTF